MLSTDQQTPDAVRRPRVALRPLTLPSNPFVDRFAEAVRAAPTETVSFEPTLAAMSSADVIILHWPNEFLGVTSRRKALWALAKVRLAKAQGARLVWVAHNLGAHEGQGASDMVARLFIDALDGVIYLSEASRALIAERYKLPAGIAEVVTVHGRYDDATPPSNFLAPEPSQPVPIVNFGLVRRYKNLDKLVAAAGELPAGQARLLIAGMRFDADFAAEIAETASTSDAVRTDFRPAHLSDQELDAVIDAHAGVVLPYRAIMNSGAALLALSRNRPVMVPNLGSMPELRDQVGSDWVYLYDGEIDAAKLSGFVAWLRDHPRPPEADLSAFAWDRVAADLRPFLMQLAAGRA